jgi:predicted ATPase
MNKLNLSIEGYKCFKEETTFEFNNITLLTGANSAGKSSVIQSLLLLKKISQGNISEQTPWISLDLNDSNYALELGRYDDIKTRSDNDYEGFFDSESIDISFVLNGGKAKIELANNIDADKVVKVSSNVDSITLFREKFDNGFVYLNAERLSPQYEYKNTDSAVFCDCHGTNTGNVIQRHENDNCSIERAFSDSDKNKWSIELDKWIDYIFPGMAVEIVPSGGNHYQVKILGNAATNVGFGITYALPILVSGLTVSEGGMLIVENPEAHLHAKAQSNMGYFLARMAAAGVRVIIETHSEHIVNGIRRMIVEGKSAMSNEDMTIYFFQNKDEEKVIKEITMDELGNLSDFPEDFFDQVRQDTLAILRIDRIKKEQENEKR